MKPLSFQPPVSRRRALWFASGSLIAAVIAVGAVCWSSSAVASSHEPAPLIAILTPHDRASVNSANLRVQALVAAVRSRNGETFVFNDRQWQEEARAAP